MIYLISNYGYLILILIVAIGIFIIFKLLAEDGFKKEFKPIHSYKINKKR